jgi:hypothetical protein
VVAWVAGREEVGELPRIALRARLVEVDRGRGAIFPGAVVELAREIPHAVSVTAIGPDRFALVWMELGPDAITTRIAVVDLDLGFLHGPVAAGVDPGFPPRIQDEPFSAVGFDGTQLLVAWPDRDDAGATRVIARFFDPDLAPLRAPESPDGMPFRLSDATTGEERSVVLAPLPAGGFVAVWEEDGVPGHEDASSSGLRAVAFDRAGARRFVNPACGRDAFQLNSVTSDAQRRPSIALLADGSLMAAWTDQSGAGDDRSGSGVRVRRFQPRELLPLP